MSEMAFEFRQSTSRVHALNITWKERVPLFPELIKFCDSFDPGLLVPKSHCPSSSLLVVYSMPKPAYALFFLPLKPHNKLKLNKYLMMETGINIALEWKMLV